MPKLQSHGRRRVGETWRQPERKDDMMRWTKPVFEELRYGFEVTMYIATR
jgi:coenzyme PQQ precursor peptide PqqA